MRVVRSITLTGVVIFSLAAGIAAALRLTRPELHSGVAPHTLIIASADFQVACPFHDAAHSSGLFHGDAAQANILELPKASADFVGYWGGNIHSSIQRFSPDLTGASPDRVSVLFGRQHDIVFMASELYSSPNQKIVHHPKARVVSPRFAIVEYESADKDLYYACSHSFRLKNPSSIGYQSTIDIYDLNSHRLMGVVTQSATLKRLLTVRDQLRFAHPGRNQVPRASISANAHFGAD